MAHHSDTQEDLGILPKDDHYEHARKAVFRGMWLLAIVTVVEVLVSLFGKGHLGFEPKGMTVILAIVGLALIVLSLYKAYYIVYNFMHMGHEVKGLRLTVLLPMLLLVWAIIAFFQEGDAWKQNRNDVLEKNAIEVEATLKPTPKKKETKVLHDDGHGDGHDDGH